MAEFPLPVYVISLARARERRIKIEDHLTSLGIKYKIFEAVDGEVLKSEDLKKYSSKKALGFIGRELTSSEIGCALSHLKIYEELKSKRFGGALILEDDALLDRNCMQVLSSLLSQNVNWDIINLVTDAPEIGLRIKLPFKHEITKLEFYSNRTTAYLINYRAAETLLWAGIPIKTSADGLLGNKKLHGLEMFGIFPNLATLSPEESTISPGFYSTREIIWKRKKLSPKFWRGRWYVLKRKLR